MYVSVIVLLTVLSLQKETVQFRVNKYCTFLEANLPCETECRKNSRCGTTNHKSDPITTDEERNAIVEVINTMREEVASGKHPRKYPTAANMNTISYDKECEFMAKCYCHICRFITQIILVSLKGKLMGFSAYGVDTFDKQSYTIDKPEIIRILNGWYLQYKNAPTFELWNRKKFLQNKVNRSLKLDIYDFMQLIWAETRYVGCSKLAYTQEARTTYVFTCVFNPGGNLNNHVTYKVGPPKSQCKQTSNTSESTWPSLCGKMRPLIEDTYVPPMINVGTLIAPHSSVFTCRTYTVVLVVLIIFCT